MRAPTLCVKSAISTTTVHAETSNSSIVTEKDTLSDSVEPYHNKTTNPTMWELDKNDTGAERPTISSETVPSPTVKMWEEHEGS